MTDVSTGTPNEAFTLNEFGKRGWSEVRMAEWSGFSVRSCLRTLREGLRADTMLKRTTRITERIMSSHKPQRNALSPCRNAQKHQAC